MVPVEEGACEECTTNCLVMHKKNRDPSPTVTTFVKFMIGDSYDEVLFLPPRFAESVRYMAGQTTKLEDSSGDGWPVKYNKIDGLLGFKEGWKKFALDHRLQVGDTLVFHYVMKTHFVVLMYGKSGCPEIRQQLIPSNVKTNGHHHVHKTSIKTKKNFTEDRNPLNVNTNGHDRVRECSSQFEHSQQVKSVNKKKNNLVAGDCSPLDVNTYGHHYVHESSSQSERSQPVLKRSKKKEDGDMVPPHGNTTNIYQDTSLSRHVTSGSHKETGQRSKPSIKNANHDTTTSGLNKEMSQRSKSLFSGIPTTVKQFNVVQNNNGNLEDECRILDPKVKAGKTSDPQNDLAFKNQLEKRVEARKKSRESIVMPIERGSSSKRSKIDNVPRTETKMLMKEPDISSTAFPSVNRLLHLTESFSKPTAPQSKRPKKEPDTSGSREGNLNDTKTRNHESPTEVNGNSFIKVKQEPDDYEEPPTVVTNSSFSAVMSSYRYLELPDWEKMSKVILLRNGSYYWPVLFETNLGLKALTQNWGLFAKERGIKPGDKCEFVLESDKKATHHVFSVRITL